jgi:hypothetical protein
MSARHKTAGEGQAAGGDAGWLTELLSTEAEQYAPDDRRIRAAMTEGAGGARRQRPVLQLCAGIAVVCAAAAVAATAMAGTWRPSTGPAVAGVLPSASQQARPAASPRAGGQRTPNTVSGHEIPTPTPATQTRPPLPSAAPSTPPAAGPLMSTSGTVDPGSRAFWDQEDAWITLDKPVATFQLTVTVVQTGGVVATGYSMNYHSSVFDTTVVAQPGAVIYHFSLQPGRTLPAGQWQFAVQFIHGLSHDPAADTYSVSVVSDAAHGAIRKASSGAF